MNRILIGCSLLWLMASCGGQKKQTEGSASENAVEQNDTVMADPSTVNDSLIVVEDFIPAAADESFVDFIYNFASDEDFQLSRIIFPISYYNDSIVQRISKEYWHFDPLFSHDQIYTVVFDREEDIELEKDTSAHSVQIDWIYLEDRHIKRYYFERKNDIWLLEAVNKEKMNTPSADVEDFYDFYARFATDSIFQSERLHKPLLFSTVDPEDEFSILETTLEGGQWFAFRPPMPTVRLSNIRYGQKESPKSNTKVLEFKGFGNGFCNTLYFRRISGIWKLVKFEDLGD